MRLTRVLSGFKAGPLRARPMPARASCARGIGARGASPDSSLFTALPPGTLGNRPKRMGFWHVSGEPRRSGHTLVIGVPAGCRPCEGRRARAGAAREHDGMLRFRGLKMAKMAGIDGTSLTLYRRPSDPIYGPGTPSVTRTRARPVRLRARHRFLTTLPIKIRRPTPSWGPLGARKVPPVSYFTGRARRPFYGPPYGNGLFFNF